MKHKIFNTMVMLAGLILPVHAQLNAGLRVPYDPCTACSDNAPANPVYQATAYFDAAAVPTVKSDFGPRYVARRSGPQPYDWHGGIDYSASSVNGDRGYHLRSIVEGTVHKIGAGGVKYIVIDGNTQEIDEVIVNHDFGYLHIFSDGELPVHNGDCHMVNLAVPYDNEVGIVVPDPGETTGFRLISDCDDCTGRYYIHNGITLNATNVVPAGSIIAVLGDSGARGNAHLHLNRYKSLANGIDFVNGDANMLDPLEFIEHSNPNYDISLHKISEVDDPDDVPTGVVISYPGTAPTKIMVRPKMAGEGNSNSYLYGTMNIAQTELLIKKESENAYYRIRGRTYESRISLGATTTNSTCYPSYVGTTGVANKGGWNRQGIFHFAYREGSDPHGSPYSTSGGRPFDDFYFTDFITRIHRDDPMDDSPDRMAHCPMDARYEDGRYHLKARVTDVRNGFTDSPVQTLVLDNFKPMIQGVEVMIGPRTVYHRYWVCTQEGSCEGIRLQREVDNGRITDAMITGMQVRATASEPLSSLTLKVGPYQGLQPLTTTPDGKTFTFQLSQFQVIPLLSLLSVEFVFEGADLSNNPLLALKRSHASEACVPLPTRLTASSWSSYTIPPGSDEVHFFNRPRDSDGRNGDPVVVIVSEGGCFMGGQGITYTTVPASNPLTADGRIEVSVAGSIPPYSYQWSNGADTPVLENVLPGQYIVTVSDALCCEQVVTITLDDNCPAAPAGTPYNLAAAVTHPSSCAAADGSLRMFNDSDYGIHLLPGPITTRRLLNAAGVAMPRANNGHWYDLPAGGYTLELTGAGGCLYLAPVNLEAADAPALEVVGQPCCVGQLNGSIQAYGLSVAGGDVLQYRWSTGLVQILPSNEVGQLVGLAPGSYCVTVTDLDNPNGCATWACVEVAQAIPTGPLTLAGQGSSTCPNQHTGALSVQVQGGTPPYTYTWSDGGATGANRIQLGAGVYCLSVTDYCGEQVSGCWEVVSEQAFSVSYVLNYDEGETIQLPDGSDLEQPTGSIILTPEPAVGNYQYQWSNGSNGSGIYGLSSGMYQVTVTDLATGCHQIHDFEILHCMNDPIPSFEAQLLGDILEPNEEFLDFRVLISENGGPFSANIPDNYQVSWTMHGSNTAIGYGPQLSIPAINFTGNWVRATIYNGCEEVALLSYFISCATSDNNPNLANSLVTYVEKPCVGFDDGSITLTIPSDPDNPVQQILVNGFSINFSPVLGNYVTATLGALSASNNPYAIRVVLQNCDLSFNYNLQERPFIRQLTGVEGDMCRYDLYCNDIVIEDELSPGWIDWRNSQGSAFGKKCTTPLRCGGQIGGNLQFDKQWTTALAYRLTLDLAFQSGYYDADYITSLRGRFNTEIGEDRPCTMVRWCKGNLRMLAWSGIVNTTPLHVPFDNNCYIANCPLDSDGLICPDEDALYGGSENSIECLPQSENLYMLWLYYDELLLLNGFSGTDLDVFIQQNGHLPEAKCTNVYFCANDFRLLGNNLASVIGTCGTPIYVCGEYVGNACEARDIIGYEGGAVGTGVLCFGNSTSANGGCDEINSGGMEFQIFCRPRILGTGTAILCPRFFWPGEDDEPALRVINTPAEPDGEVLVGFSKSLEQGGSELPKGIYSSGGKLRFEDFRQDYVLTPHRKEDGIKRYVDDWVNQRLAYVSVVENGIQEHLVYETNDTAWSVAFGADQRLAITDLSLSDDGVMVAGVAQGTLYLGEGAVLHSQTAYRFFAKIDAWGQPIDIQTAQLTSWSQAGKTLFTGEGGWLMSGAYQNGTAVIDNQVVALDATAGYYLAKSDEANGFAMVADLRASGSLTLQAMATTAGMGGTTDTHRYAVAFSGDGLLAANDEIVLNELSSPQLVVAVLDHLGNVAWSTSIEKSKLNADKFAMTFDSAGNLYLAVTPTADLSIQNHLVESQGGEDILLLRYNPQGQLTGSLPFATDRRENVSAWAQLRFVPLI